MDNDNFFSLLRAAFPEDIDTVAIDAGAVDGGERLRYSWRDIDRSSAMLANLLASRDLPVGSRIAVQVDPSVEALMLCLATLRAGHVWLLLDAAGQSPEMAHVLADARPAVVVVCCKRNFGWVSKLAFVNGARHVFTLDADRSGSLLERAVFFSDQQTPVPRAANDPAAIIPASGTAGPGKGATLSHGDMRSNAQVLSRCWDWRPENAAVRALLSGE
jgi:malonyl-CoA/methylmalonyl-CoA synthetase